LQENPRKPRKFAGFREREASRQTPTPINLLYQYSRRTKALFESTRSKSRHNSNNSQIQVLHTLQIDKSLSAAALPLGDDLSSSKISQVSRAAGYAANGHKLRAQNRVDPNTQRVMID
jgi:hypothetical protein